MKILVVENDKKPGRFLLSLTGSFPSNAQITSRLEKSMRAFSSQ